MRVVKDRLWLVLKIGDGVAQSNLPASDGDTSSVDLLEGVSLDDKQSCTRLKALMRGVPGVWVGQEGDRLVLVTDAYGMLPVFSYRAGDTYYFFTHFPDLVAAVPSLSLTPDPAGIWEAMTFDLILGRRTVFQEICMFPPSSVIVIDCQTGTERVIPYDHLSFEKLSNITEVEAGAQVAELLESVLAGMAGDHFLLPLSGGVDSRLLATAMVKVFGPERITALTYACRPTSYEFVYAQRTCDILGIKDWRGYILTADSYLRSLRIFPERLGGGMSIAHGHLFDALSFKKNEWIGMTLVSGAFADAAGGYGAKPPELRSQPVEQSHYYRHLEKVDTSLHLGETKALIEQDIRDIYAGWQDGSVVETFDEYSYITQRQPRLLFAQSLLYQDILPAAQPFTDPDLAEFLLGLPYDLRHYKRAIRAAIRHLNVDLYKLPDISSKMIQESVFDWFDVYRGKVINNLSMLLTFAAGNRHLFFSPYQTECQDYNLRTSHRRLALDAIDTLQTYGLVSSGQAQILKKKPYRPYRGLLLPCIQYWAITIAAALKQFSG